MYLLDTNIVSELVRPEPDNNVVFWSEGVREAAISVVTLEEIKFGLSWKPNARVQHYLDEFFFSWLQVIPVTGEIASQAGTMRGGFMSRGKSRTQADMFIAATAIHYGFTLVTRNIRDFDGCPVTILNPFSD
jgi:toxin FitB